MKLRRYLSVLLAFCLCLGMLPTAALAAEKNFNIDENGVLISYSGLAGDVVIPDGITAIGDRAFYNCQDLQSVTIPDSVAAIGNEAFHNCYRLTSVTIPTGVTSIGDEAFSQCSDLTDVTIPGSVTSIGSSAFSYCRKLNSLTISNGVTSIGDQAFYNCDSLSSVTIPNSVTSIGGAVFSACTSLKSVTIPNGVTDIGVAAFYCCTSLADVTIPGSVTSIGDSAFNYCAGLTSISIPDGVTTIGNSAFFGCTSLTSVTIPNGVTAIGNSAFCDCTGLKSVTIPNGVTDIKAYTFRGCTSLTDVAIPDSVTSIGECAFYECRGLTSVTIPDSVTVIDNLAFSGCTNLATAAVPSTAKMAHASFPETTKVTYVGNFFDVQDGVLKGYRGPGGDITIPNTVTKIGRSALREHTEITDVTIPDSVTTIDRQAFQDCANLTSVTFGSGLTFIDDGAFAGCTKLTAVSVPSGAKLNSNAFPSATKITLSGHYFDIPNGVLESYKGPGGNITIPDNVTSIGDHAFSGNTDLTGVTIPGSVTTIERNAFSGCTSLTNVTLGNNVTSISSYAFSGCTSLTEVIIPNSVTGIGYGAFSNCTGLKKVTIPDSVTQIGNSAFSGCTSLTSVTLPYSTTVAYSAFPDTKIIRAGGDYFDIQKGVLTGYRGPGGDVVIPGGVTRIPGSYGGEFSVYSPFEYNKTLTSITIPEGVTNIEPRTFANCTTLTSVTLPNSLTCISRGAFSGCTSLTSITIPNGVTTIEQDAFSGCTGLTSMTIPGSVTSMERNTFWGCDNLTSVTIGNGVKTVELSAPNLEHISLPDSVEKISISSNALRELVIPAGVTDWPTLNCPRLTKLTFPKGNWVFKGISRADFMDKIKRYPALNEIVNCPNEFVDDLIADNVAIQNNWTAPRSTIMAQSARITKLSNEITAGLAGDYDKAKAISKWVVDHIKYDDDYYYAGLKDYSDVPFNPEDILDKGQAVCAGFARLTQALLVAQNIPCLYVLGWAPEGYHAWNLALIDGDLLWIDNTWGMNYFGLGVYAISKDHKSTGAASFNDVKGPGTLVSGSTTTKDAGLAEAEKAGIGTALPETAEEILAREKIEALKSQYPEGMSWTNSNSYYSEGLHSTGSGCAGFAYICSDAVFGKAPAGESHSDFNKIRVGDILRINNDTHSVVVLRKMSDGVIVTEGNYNSSIHWNRAISKADLEKGGMKVTTRWGTAAQEKTTAVNSVLPSATGTAYASTQAVEVDGRKVEFQCYALKDQSGNDTNYIKLRDLADILNGTDAQFQVGWDGSVTITTNQGYTRNGSEQKTPFSGQRNYVRASAPTNIDGAHASLSAFLLNDDQGGGYTYYQLRELGQAIDFNVGWSAERGIYLETAKPYDTNN